MGKQQPTPGYPENVPDDSREARQPAPGKPPNPDEGGLQRPPEEQSSTG